MKQAKKYTLLSLATITAGFLLPLINSIWISYDLYLYQIGMFLVYMGILVTYVFCMIWASQISKTRLFTAVIITGLLFVTHLFYCNQKLDIAQENNEASRVFAEEAEKQAEEARKQIDSATEALIKAEKKIDSLTRRLER